MPGEESTQGITQAVMPQKEQAFCLASSRHDMQAGYKYSPAVKLLIMDQSTCSGC